MTLSEKTKDIDEMIAQGKLLDAFDKYDADDVTITEPGGTWKGKTDCRNHEIEFLDMVRDFHRIELKAVASDEQAGIVMHETAMDVTCQDGKRVNVEQDGVQRWEDGKIVHERFYYQD